MFKTIPQWAGFLALVMMIALPSLLLVKSFYDREQGRVWLVDIDGYDPRDLLYGHYLNFTYDWNFATPQDGGQCYGRNCCICLNESVPGSIRAPLAKTLRCDAPERGQCSSVITGGHGRHPAVRGQRYYVPEKDGLRLEGILRDEQHEAQMEIAVPRSGGPAMIRKLYIDQQPLEEFLIKAQR